MEGRNNHGQNSRQAKTKGKMMFDFRIDLIGEAAVAARYAAAPGKIKGQIDRELTQIGFIVQRTARRFAPFLEGNLERSISFRLGSGYVDCFVPINSRAGQYAKWVHDGFYNRGKRTRQKGPQADRKYIQRAITADKAKIKLRAKRVFDILGFD